MAMAYVVFGVLAVLVLLGFGVRRSLRVGMNGGDWGLIVSGVVVISLVVLFSVHGR